MEKRVLFVDDEQNVLSAIKRMLFDETYEQFFVGSGPEALNFLRQTPVAVIVSDMRMPIMDGVFFLEKSQEIVPTAIRIILSGQAELGSVMQAINRGGIWRFITKPWNDNDLKCTINNALELYRIQEERAMLLKVLAQKNSELQTLNQELERRVEERTHLIEAQKQLLQHIVDGVELSTFAAAACRVIGELVNSERTALLHAIGAQSIIYFKEAPSEDQKQLLVSSLLSGKNARGDTYMTVSVVHSSSVIGVIGIGYQKDSSLDGINEILANIMPIVALALSQFKMITDAPRMMNDLDDLIDRL